MDRNKRKCLECEEAGSAVEMGGNLILEIERRALMRRVFILVLSGLAGCLALSPAMRASSPDPDDYPLRVHILQFNGHAPSKRDSKSFTGMPDYIQGEGHADIFEHGEPQGFEFHNSCLQRLEVDGGYGTIPARWKKKGKTLDILVPQRGKPWNMDVCELQVDMRPGLAYFWTDDSVVEESSATFKEWMVKHLYDPEKGQDQPLDEPAEAGGGGGAGSSSSQHPESH
jgi:hypothetical protein